MGTVIREETVLSRSIPPYRGPYTPIMGSIFSLLGPYSDRDVANNEGEVTEVKGGRGEDPQGGDVDGRRRAASGRSEEAYERAPPPKTHPKPPPNPPPAPTPPPPLPPLPPQARRLPRGCGDGTGVAAL